VKCDEAKPSCYLCISTGRKCDGYEPNIEARQDISSVVLGALNQSPIAGFLETQNERRCFYFFRQNTAPQLSGFFGGDFWERLLLQAAFYEPSIRHAILALGSLHAQVEEDNSSNMQGHFSRWSNDFALKNYGQAINLLVKPLSQEGQQAIDLCLICSILFACFEVSQYQFQTSFLLISVDNAKQLRLCYHTRPERHEDPMRY
jgi:hypothetical protein